MKLLRLESNQHGAVAVLVALILVVLIGVAGLVIDLGRLFVVKTELQNATDACALAAARELNAVTKTLAVLTRAENAGIEVGNRHFTDFQHNPAQFVADQDVTFSQTLDGSYVTKGGAPTDVEYARCTRQVTGILPWLMQILGVGSQHVAATAVATLQGGSSVCAIPLGMCTRVAPPPCTVAGVTPDKFGLCKGQWYSGRFESGGSATGNFNWLDYTPPGGGAGELDEILAGPGYCEIGPDAVFHAEQGEMQSVKDAWNSRFGLYKNSGQWNANTAPPDFTGYSYGPTNWPQGHDAYPDYLVRQATYQSYGYPADSTAAGNNATGLDVKNSFRTSASGINGPHGRGTHDRRLVAIPAVNCATWGPGHQVEVSGWVCALMVTPLSGPNDEVVLEYLGDVQVEETPCGAFGLAGGPGGIGPRVPTLVQ